MDNVVLMDELDSSKDLIKNIYTLLSRKDFIGEFALKIVKISHVTVFHDQKVPVALLHKKISTFESLVQFDDVGMVQTGHSVDLLKEKLFEKGVFDHFLFGDALDSVKCGGRGGFGGK